MKNAGSQSAVHPDYYLDCLRRVSLFSSLADSDLACFQVAARSRFCRKGLVLYLQENVADLFYVLCSGWVKLFHTTQEGEEIVVDMLTTGHLVGESSIFEGDHHTSSAQIVEDASLLSIPSGLLKNQIISNPRLAFSMLAAMSLHHRHHYDEIAVNATHSAPQRIGDFLLRLCPRGRTSSVVLHLPYDKTLIANTLGMKGATFSRALNILRQKTGIRICGTQVEIDSVACLAQFVHGPLVTDYELKKSTTI